MSRCSEEERCAVVKVCAKLFDGAIDGVFGIGDAEGTPFAEGGATKGRTPSKERALLALGASDARVYGEGRGRWGGGRLWGEDGLHELIDHCLEVVKEGLRIQFAPLDLAELVFPFPRESSALQ